MRDAIIRASIESLRQEGLRFSVDTLSEKLKISKKTVYKYFPDKESLALALYETYYSDAAAQAGQLAGQNTADAHRKLLAVYFDSKVMTRSGIFNKYKLNQTVRAYTAGKSDSLWKIIAASFCGETSGDETKTLRIIVDGSFEKLSDAGLAPDDVIERLVNLLW
ncbi:MAG: TetR/AcrR family transcriptional regulator [Firmicutes bacterium]|nr:TetR/AcrR family transcriptional regulator [Bacillota bacterium]